jgi:predicted amidophosphoribosyltransferase
METKSVCKYCGLWRATEGIYCDNCLREVVGDLRSLLRCSARLPGDAVLHRVLIHFAHNFARTAWHYVFESVKSTAESSVKRSNRYI